MAYLVKPEPGLSLEPDFARYAHVPFILARTFDYLDWPSLFLRDRAIGLWRPTTTEVTSYATPKILAANTVLAMGEDLTNHWTYLEERTDGLCFPGDFPDLVVQYQAEMTSGDWSSNGEGLAKSTIRRRLVVVVQFQNWFVRGHAGPLIVPGARKTRPKRPAAPAAGPRRASRPDPRNLRMPEPAEVQTWLAEVGERSGPTLALACRTILKTGTRLEETTLFPAENLPSLDSISPGAVCARMFIEHGTKGQRDPYDQEKRGKSRWLRVPTQFLMRLHDYHTLRRRRAVELYKGAHQGRQPVELLLSERTGEPFTTEQLYRAWHDCRNLPYKGFSPHLGRHYFVKSPAILTL